MGQRVWKILLRMIFACVVLGESGSVIAANAQNADLIAKLATLTLRKGTPLPLGSTSANLGLPQAFDDCRGFNSPFEDAQGVGQAVAVLTDPGFRSSVILLKAVPDAQKSLLISLHGDSLATAVYRPRPVGTWSTVAVDAPETKGEVAEETSCWRTQQAQLANEPDRKD